MPLAQFQRFKPENQSRDKQQANQGAPGWPLGMIKRHFCQVWPMFFNTPSSQFCRLDVGTLRIHPKPARPLVPQRDQRASIQRFGFHLRLPKTWPSGCLATYITPLVTLSHDGRAHPSKIATLGRVILQATGVAWSACGCFANQLGLIHKTISPSAKPDQKSSGWGRFLCFDGLGPVNLSRGAHG